MDVLTWEPVQLYRGLLERDKALDGLVFYGIRTTGIFCRSVCSARKPKFENCEFFASAQDALLAGYRPCKRCQPLELPGAAAEWARELIDAVEREPHRRWSDADFQALGVSSSTVRRQFKEKYGMTFVAYARSRRLGLALTEIRSGKSVINAQLTAGYQSASGFRDAFAHIFGAAPSKRAATTTLFARWIETPLGPMLGIATDTHLRLLDFTDRRGMERAIEKLRTVERAAIVPGNCGPLESIAREMELYFKGQLTTFTTLIYQRGSAFQQSVWQALRDIPAGEVRSYSEQATAIGSPAAVRAVARANGANFLSIIVPCHRVIGSNGDLTGYGGGLHRKQWLLDHECKTAPTQPSTSTACALA